MAHIQLTDVIRKEVAMLIAALHSILDRIARETAILTRARARKRANAQAVRHLAGLPAYLRRDVGLPDGTDIARAVDSGVTDRPARTGTRCPQPIQPHAI